MTINHVTKVWYFPFTDIIYYTTNSMINKTPSNYCKCAKNNVLLSTVQSDMNNLFCTAMILGPLLLER